MDKLDLAIQHVLKENQAWADALRKGQLDARMARRKRLRKVRLQKFRDAIELGRSTKVIVNPTTKDSQEIQDDVKDHLVVKEETRRRVELIRRFMRRRKKKGTKVLLRPDMTRSGSFPPLNEEQAQRLNHCRQAMRELNDILEPDLRRKVQTIRRVLREMNS